MDWQAINVLVQIICFIYSFINHEAQTGKCVHSKIGIMSLKCRRLLTINIRLSMLLCTANVIRVIKMPVEKILNFFG